MDASTTDGEAGTNSRRCNASRKKRLVFAAVALLATSALTVLGVEGAFRLFPGLLPYEVRVQTALQDSVERLYAADPVLEHRAVPGFDAEVPHRECPHHVRTVSLPHMPPEWGFRTPPLDPDRPVHAAVLGDSFAFGYGVAKEEMLAGLLRAERTASGQVVNLGLSNMTGTLQYEMILDRFLAHYRPVEVIILHFENDYTDDDFFHKWQRLAEQDPSLAYPASRHLNVSDNPGPLVRLKRRSICASLLANAVHKLEARGRRVDGDGAAYVPSPEVLQIVAEDNAEARRGCELGIAALGRMFAACGDASADVTVVMIPSKEQALLPEEELGKYLQFYRRTAAFCRDQGVTVVDTLEAFRRHVRTQQLFFAVDGHWTAAGHALAHRLLRASIASRPSALQTK